MPRLRGGGSGHHFRLNFRRTNDYGTAAQRFQQVFFLRHFRRQRHCFVVALRANVNGFARGLHRDVQHPSVVFAIETIGKTHHRGEPRNALLLDGRQRSVARMRSAGLGAAMVAGYQGSIPEAEADREPFDR